MNNNIIIKSVAKERIRLKSKYFTANNITDIQRRLQQFVSVFRANIICNSIVIEKKSSVTFEQIIQELEFHFPHTHSKTCDIGCSSCVKSNPKKFQQDSVQFGLLSLCATALYLFPVPTFIIATISFIAAIPLIKESIEDIKNSTFSLHTFMGGTLLLAIIFGEAMAAFEIIYILRGSQLLEEYIASKSKKEISSLVSLDIKKAYKLMGNYELEVDIDDLLVGDVIVCKSGDKIPVDGLIIDGVANINEAIINGRSEAIYKKENDTVFAGSICESGHINIEVTAKSSQTYIARVMHQVELSLANKTPAQLQADRLASKLLKLGSFLTIGTFVFTGSILNAFSVMIVMSCPCATILAASTAISAGVLRGAKEGVFVKSAEAFERISQADVICFDKTGTLTTGKPKVVDCYFDTNSSLIQLSYFAAIAEYRNSHPLALAISEHAKMLGIDVDTNGQSEIIPGYGVKTIFEESLILVGNKALMASNKIATKFSAEYEQAIMQGNSVVYVAVNKEIVGLISFAHEIREDTIEMLQALKSHGVKKIVLLTGDEYKAAHSFAHLLGRDIFDDIYTDLTPTKKAEVIEELKKTHKNVVMVGDGVNDTLAMSKADVAISFAADGCETAIEASDIAISHSHPKDVINLYELSKKSLQVINQNYYLGTGTNLIGVGFAAFGMLSPVAAGAIHIGHTIGIMANSARLLHHNCNKRIHN